MTLNILYTHCECAVVRENYICCCSLVSQCSLNPPVNPSPAFSLCSLRSTGHAIPPTRCTPSPHAHAHADTQTQQRLLLCALGGREIRGVMRGCIWEHMRIISFIVNLFLSHIKSCRTYSSPQCSLCLTTRDGFWDGLV